MPRIAAGDIEIEYERFGAPTDPAILLVSGFGSQLMSWAVPFCTRLAAHGFQVLRYDNRDVGRSTWLDHLPAPRATDLMAAAQRGDPLPPPYPLDAMAADGLALCTALGIERAHVVGRSMGGMIAQRMATSWPDRVLSLTSIMSTTGAPGLPAADPEVMRLMIGPMPNPRVDRAGFLAHQIEFSRALTGRGFVLDEVAERAAIEAAIDRALHPAGVARQLAAVVTAGDLTPRLQALSVPTLVIHGSDDRLVPPACGAATAEAIPDASWLLIDGMGHRVPPESWDTVIPAIVALTRRAASA